MSLVFDQPFSVYHQITKGFNLGLGYRLSENWGWNYGLRQDQINHLSFSFYRYS